MLRKQRIRLKTKRGRRTIDRRKIMIGREHSKKGLRYVLKTVSCVLLQKEQEEVERGLRKYEEKLRRREAVRQAEIEKRVKSRREIEKQIDTSRPNPRFERMQKTAFEDFYKTYQKLKKLETRQQEEQELREYNMTQAEQKREQVRENRLKEIRNNERTRMVKLKTKFTRQDQALQKFRENFKEDMEERKEIQMLKKIDQEENLQRTKNFYVSNYNSKALQELYRLKLVEKIKSKMERAVTMRTVKEQVKEFYDYQTNNLLRRSQGILQTRNGINLHYNTLNEPSA